MYALGSYKNTLKIILKTTILYILSINVEKLTEPRDNPKTLN